MRRTFKHGRQDHIAKDLRTPKYRPRVVRPRKAIDEDDKWRRLDDYGIGYDPYYEGEKD